MDTIAYLVYGNRLEYQLELTYSVLSAAHFIKNDPSQWRIVLITSAHSPRYDLPVEHLFYTEDEFTAWTRGGTYMHKAKVHALSKAVNHYKSRVALIDTDTAFLAHPATLFQKVGPGKSVMHALDGTLENHAYWQPLLEKITGSVSGFEVNESSRMLNSGVVGIDYADKELLNKVCDFIDALQAISPVFDIEQFAFGTVLDRFTSLSTCPETVRHYWGYERAFFHSQIAELFPEFSPDRFNRYVSNPPKLVGFPPKRLTDQVRARIVAKLRRQGADYRFAYLAYLSALSSRATSQRNANAWATVAVRSLQRQNLDAPYVQRDFRGLARPDECTWMNADTVRLCSHYWRELNLRQKSSS